MATAIASVRRGVFSRRRRSVVADIVGCTFRLPRCSSSVPSTQSALGESANDLRIDVLRAAHTRRCHVPEDPSSAANSSHDVGGQLGDWAAVRGQAATVEGWPEHPLSPAERLALAEGFLEKAAEMQLVGLHQGKALCEVYSKLLSPTGVFNPRSDGTAHCGVVSLTHEKHLAAACSEATGMLLRGYAVSIAAPAGPAFEAVTALAESFPAALLQAVESSPLDTMPRTVHAFRLLGVPSGEQWSEQAPPADFGGCDRDGDFHGMAAAATALSLARTDVTELARLPRSRYEFNDEAADLAALLSTTSDVDAPSAPGLPPPRWARSAYDRGVEEANDLVDLLWAFREPHIFTEAGESEACALVPAPKHFMLTIGADIPDEIIKAAVVSALSPFSEPVTLHAVGLGSHGLSKDPLRGFCRLVQSGRAGLQWRIVEHDSWAGFMDWLKVHGGASDLPEAPALFGTLRGMDVDLKRLCAASGGVAWGKLFTAEPLEQLRRWTRPIVRTPDQMEIMQRSILRDTTSQPHVDIYVAPPSGD